jgi:hypothetical protein
MIVLILSGTSRASRVEARLVEGDEPVIDMGLD